MTKRIRVLIADDHAVVRSGLRAMLGDDDLEVVGEAVNGEEALRRAAELTPDVVLMDLSMPELDGFGATRRLKVAMPNVQIVVLTTFETEADVSRAIDAGAIGYLLKDAGRSEIVAAVRAAATPRLARGGASDGEEQDGCAFAHATRARRPRARREGRDQRRDREGPSHQ
jgi:DNA-binding NarL/FixJ family response regulator